MKTWLFVAIFLVVIILFSRDAVKEQVSVRTRTPGPREYPVYTDDPKMYLNQQILYSEWDQKLNSVVI